MIQYWLESLKGRAHSQDLGVDGRLLLQWILGNMVRGYGLDPSGPG
jgi:hypothetical protein